MLSIGLKADRAFAPVATFPANLTITAASAGDTLVLFVGANTQSSGYSLAHVTSVTCTNVTWSLAGYVDNSASGTGIGSCEVWIGQVSSSANSGTTITVGYQQHGTNWVTFSYAEFGGVSGLDAVGGFQTAVNSSGGASFSTASYTSGAPYDIVVGCVFDISNGTQIPSPGGSWLTAIESTATSGDVASTVVYQIPASTGPFSATFTSLETSYPKSACAVSFGLSAVKGAILRSAGFGITGQTASQAETITAAGNGNSLLVAVADYSGGADPVTSITCTNVTFTLIGSIDNHLGITSGEYGAQLYLYLGQVAGGNSGTTLTVNVKSSAYLGIAYVELIGAMGLDGSFLSSVAAGSGLFSWASYTNSYTNSLLLCVFSQTSLTNTSPPSGWANLCGSSGGTAPFCSVSLFYLYPGTAGTWQPSYSSAPDPTYFLSPCGLIGGLCAPQQIPNQPVGVSASGSGALTANVVPSAFTGTSATGAGTLAPSLQQSAILAGTAASSGAALATCIMRPQSVAGSSATGAGTVSIGASAKLAGASATGKGTLSTATFYAASPSGSSTAGVGALSFILEMPLAGTLPGTSTATATSERVTYGTGTLVSTSTASAYSYFLLAGAAAGNSAVTSTGQRILHPIAAVTGASVAAATATHLEYGSVALTGSNTATAYCYFVVTGTTAGISIATAAAIRIATPTGTIAGASDATATLTKVESTEVAAASAAGNSTAFADGTVFSGIPQYVSGVLSAGSTLAATPNILFNVVGASPSGSWYNISAIRVAVVTDSYTDGESLISATPFKQATASASSTSYAFGSGMRSRMLAANISGTSVDAATAQVTQQSTGTLDGSSIAALNPMLSITGVLAGNNDLDGSAIGYLTGFAKADGAATVNGESQYLLSGALTGSNTAFLNCMLPLEAVVAGASAAAGEPGYLTDVFAETRSSSAAWGMLISARANYNVLAGVATIAGALTQIYGAVGSSTGRADIQGRLRSSVIAATVRAGSWSTITGTITLPVAATGHADSASQAQSSANVNVVFATAACTDTASSLSADDSGCYAQASESDGASAAEADTQCLFAGEAYIQQRSTVQAVPSGLESIFAVSASYSFVRATPKPRVVLVTAAAAGSSTDYYMQPPVSGGPADANGYGDLTGYLTSTIDATGKIWCLSYSVAKGARSKPITGVPIAGQSTLIATAA